MNQKLMLINVTDDESRIAVVEEGLLQDMLIEHETREQLKNNIYKGIVVQIQTALQAAFVDFGNKKHGFLPSSEVNPLYFHSSNARKESPIQQKLKVGQEIIVQVTREAIEHKGAALTTNVTIPGRFMVMMPNSEKGGVSKKIEDEDERTRLKSFLSGIESEEHSVIIRTAGMGRDLVELKKDYTALKKTWGDINRSFRAADRPGLLKEEDDVVTRTLRDYYTEDISEIWVDNAETFQKALNFFKINAPRRQKDLKLFVGDRSLFATYNIERQVEQLTAREVKLKSGGSIVIDQTEALVAIDVNSGKSNKDENIDDTALRTNMEAAKEIARQLRLRNLGGLIVIDFIDMETEPARKKVEQQLQNAMSRDKAQRKYNPISQFGLLEMSRQRLTQGISRTVESICPTCGGKGKIPSVSASTNLILRSIREIAAKGNLLKIEGELPLELANTLLNERRQSITDLELEFGINISLKGNPEMVSFNEKCLKPTYDEYVPQKKVEDITRKERNKNDRSHRRHKDQEQNGRYQKNDNFSSTKSEISDIESEEEGIDAFENEPKHKGKKPESPELRFESSAISPKKVVQPKEQLFEKHDEEVKPAEYKEEEEKEEFLAEEIKENISKPKIEFIPTLHSACLFPEVKDLSKEELEDITLSFGNRLKGKIEDRPFPQYDSKFLWQAEPKEESPAEEELDESVPEDVLNEKGTITEEKDEISVMSENEIEENNQEEDQNTEAFSENSSLINSKEEEEDIYSSPEKTPDYKDRHQEEETFQSNHDELPDFIEEHQTEEDAVSTIPDNPIDEESSSSEPIEMSENETNPTVENEDFSVDKEEIKKIKRRPRPSRKRSLSKKPKVEPSVESNEISSQEEAAPKKSSSGRSNRTNRKKVVKKVKESTVEADSSNEENPVAIEQETSE